MRFTKMEGTGNDFVCVDARVAETPDDLSSLAREVCDRRTGIGADGLMIIRAEAGADAHMTVWNADGSRADMCGNGLRCAVRLLAGDGSGRRTFRVATDSGVFAAEVIADEGSRSRVQTVVGYPELERSAIPMVGGAGAVSEESFDLDGRRLTVSALRLGNPHCVVWTDDVENEDVARLGAALETHVAFPDSVNVSFVEVVARDRVRQRTWERGCGETMSCGTGAAATCVAGVVAGRTDREVEVTLPGGVLNLHWPADDDGVILSGPARTVFEGTWPWR